MATELEWAVGQFQPGDKRLKAYRLFDDYYNGTQPMAFATKKYRGQFWSTFRGYADNMCQSVVDVQSERLEISGFTSSEATVVEEKIREADDNGPEVSITALDDRLGDAAWDEWETESMDLVADQVHSDAFQYGDAFLIADKDGVWRQEPSEMAVRYSSEFPGRLELAAKCWREVDDSIRLNVYTNDKTFKYQSKGKPKRGTKLTPDMFKSVGEVENPQGIPVVHFPNKRYGRYGISELAAVIPLQDALNKAEMDLIVAMEYQAFKQRWTTGVDVELNEDGTPKPIPGAHGPGNFLSFADPEAKVGEFGAADLAPYVKVIENLRGQIARVSGIPPHYFFVGESGASASGESLKVGESRFTRKGARQQRCFGKTWELTMALVLEITSAAEGGDVDADDDFDLNVLWAETSPRSESEDLDVLVKKGTIGVPNSQLQKEAGYDPDEIRQFAIEFAHNVNQGLQNAPLRNDRGQVVVEQGETSASARSQVSPDAGMAVADD